MPQKTNLNISPYFDDFDKADQFYKILFKPGYPVQARELTGLQSLLQNQVEAFGKHIFKEGSMVIPGNIELDTTYFSAKVNETHLGIDVSIYLSDIIAANGGKGIRVRGQNSGIVATIKNFILPPSEGVEKITIFIKYIQSGTSGESTTFPDSEVLILEEPLTYGNTTLSVGETILTLVSDNATATGSAFGISTGVYFLRGAFVDVSSQLLILDPYNNQPSYRVGFDISEEIINSNDDSSLYDNAKGFTNFAAPGADRFKISVQLAKKSLTDYEDTNFVELMRTDQGEIKRLQDDSVYSKIKEYFAKRTFDESGDYSVEPFRIQLQESLNDEIGNEGLFTADRLTDDNRLIPNENLLALKLSPGRAYVKGFDVDLPGSIILDVNKPRKTLNVNSASIPFEMGSLIRVNNVQGVPNINIGGSSSNTIQLHSKRKTGSNSFNGSKVGEARVYYYSLTDDTYKGQTTSFDLYLYDIQTFIILKCNEFDNVKVLQGSRIRGLSSGAIGYVTENAGTSGTNEISVSQTTGRFIRGEQIILDEVESNDKISIKEIVFYTIDDIKSVFQDSNALNSGLLTDFSADTVLYDRQLTGFSLNDTINVVGTAATVVNGNFSGNAGINTSSIISFSDGIHSDPVFNEVEAISVEGKTLTLNAAPSFVTGICTNNTVSASQTTSSTFKIKVPRVLNLEKSGIFGELPKPNISNVNLADSNLIISRQITGGAANITNNTISFNSSVGLTTSVGITSVFFEPFDAERYSIHYPDGTTETLTDDQFSTINGGETVTFSGLSKASGAAVVNVTLKKLGTTSKTKDFVRSQTLEVTRTSRVNTINSGLTTTSNYGMRVEDEEISLNVPDVVNIVAIYESKDTDTPVLDKLTFVSGSTLNTDSIIGEKIIGKDSRAIGQIVSRTANTVDFVYLNGNQFTVGELINFEESNIETILQGVTVGNFIDRTTNYTLDKGHKLQYCDYSKIIRNANAGAPSKKLLIIFDQFQSGISGDVFTVNSYTAERYTKDIPILAGQIAASDIIDYRPRVKPFNLSDFGNSTNVSPFAFTSRSFETSNPFVITPNESSIMGFDYYVGRIDKVIIGQEENVDVIEGESAENPVTPSVNTDAMEIAEIIYPPYLYDVSDAFIKMKDNRRFTMRDIASLEKRIKNLENISSLNALELETASFQVRDADGLNRFKTGFVAYNFRNRDFIDFSNETGSRCDVDVTNEQLYSAIDYWSMDPELALDSNIDVNTADLNSNLKLSDPNCQKTGDLITLAYEEVDWIENPQATTTENVNPFNVIAFHGLVILDPPSDNWTRTIYINNERKESTGNTWVERSNIVRDVSVRGRTTTTTSTSRTGRETRTTTTSTTPVTRTVERSFTNVLEGNEEERDFIESTKVESAVDPFMRSRNVTYFASGLKPLTRHYHFLDSGIPDVIPKLFEIQMTSGTFTVFEDVKVELNGVEIGLIRSQEPNHKFGDLSRPEVAAALGSPSVSVEKYIIDPYDQSRPAPSSTYSATSRLFNVDCIGLAHKEKYFGYVVKGAKLTGKTSGAVASVTNVNLLSDNWGDVIGSFFFRNANQTPKPPTLFTSGTKTFKITSQADGTIPLPSDIPLASSCTGTFLGTGTVLTQTNNIVQVRNPPRPPEKENEIVVTTRDEVTSRTTATRRGGRRRRRRGRRRGGRRGGGRDPLAQSFRVNETGAFLTSFDVYFASKDPNAKLTVQLRFVELGTPTERLVQDYAEIVVSPDYINVSDDASVPTTLKFQSPIFLPPDEEFALVFLAPSSDKFTMWCSTMGEKSVKSANLPDVQNVVVSKQYLGGSLFKSQNGTIWTASQNQDLTFKLRKAKFVDSGTVRFYNSPIEPGNFNTQLLVHNPIRSLPRKLRVAIDGSGTRTVANLPIGRKVSTGAASDSEDVSVTGVIEGHGGSIVGAGDLISGGVGYSFSSLTAVPTVPLTGSGTGCTVNLTVVNESVTAVAINGVGSGYQIGDVLTVDNSNAQVIRGAGLKFVVKNISTTFDTLFLTDVQGDKFPNNEALVEYGTNNDTRAVISNVAVNGDSVQNGELFSGKVLEVLQINHAHHGANNKVEIKDVKPDTLLVPITEAMTAESTSVSIGNTAPFSKFAGITATTGQALIENEIVQYTVGTDVLSLVRGVGDTVAVPHAVGTNIQTYEAAGMPLVGINTVITVPANASIRSESDIDFYYLEVDTAAITSRTDKQLLCFTDERAFGGNTVKISQNHQYSSIEPDVNFLTPSTTTDITASVRTISGTSAGGNEVSFLDQGVQPIALNQFTHFDNTRLVASTVNEDKLTGLPKQKSVILDMNLTSADVNLSPVVDLKNLTLIYLRNKINNPIGFNNYATDSRTNQLRNDPHASSFVTERIELAQPATSLKVLVGASIEEGADFRVFYRLFSPDSSEVSSTYRAFPGYANMLDTDGDGFGDVVIDEANNDGRADAFVRNSKFDEFNEYQFTVDNLEQFSAFTIKIVMTQTNECKPVRIRDFRAIALA